MSEHELQILERVAAEMGEGAAFLFTDPVPAAQRPKPGAWEAVGVSLAFSGSRSGTVSLWAEPAFARTAAANMLGIDEDSEDARARGTDALKELLNIIVGRFVTEAYGEQELFHLGLPRQKDAAALDGDMAAAGAVWLSAESRPVLLVLE